MFVAALAVWYRVVTPFLAMALLQTCQNLQFVDIVLEYIHMNVLGSGDIKHPFGLIT